MKKILGSSPKTTIIGLLGALVYGLTIVNPKNIADWKTWIVPVIIVAYGRVSKDSNGITGSEARAIIKPKDEA